MIKPLGIILAGGQSTRMGGGDKGLLDLAGKPLLAHVIDRLAPQASAIALNANGDASRFAAYSLPVIADSIDGFAGPLAGVLAGLDWASEHGASHIVTAAADTPFFPTDLVARLMTALSAQTPISMATTPDPERSNNRHPTFAIWPVALRNDLRAALTAGLRKVILWTDQHGCAEVEFAATPFDPFFNVNTPADIARARMLLAEGQS